MTSIKIQDKGARTQYTALAAQTNFAYPFEIFTDADLKVWLTPLGQTPDPVLDLLVLTTDYGVTGAGVEGGGDVILNTPATAGDIITIIRDIPIERLFDYTVGGDFTGDSINQQLDVLTMTQQQNESVNQTRQLTYPALEELETGDVTLPQLAIGQFWKKSGAGAIAAVTLEENPDWSTLRTELANELSGSDGSRMIGYHSTKTGSTTVHDALDDVIEGLVYYGVTTGTPNTYTTTISGISVYFDGLTLELRMHASNTGAPTVNVNGLGPLNLKRSDNTALQSGDLIINRSYTFIHNGADLLLSDIPPASRTSSGTIKLNNPGIVQAWAVYDGATDSLEKNYNIPTVTKNTAGDYTFNLGITSSSVTYAVQVSCVGALVGAPDGVMTQSVIGIAANNFSIELFDKNGVLRDSNQIYVTVFGDDFT
jgi:hypothetical protein